MEIKDSSSLLREIREQGIFPSQLRATPIDFIPIPFIKNVLGAFGAYAVKVPLDPYYNDLRVTHVNGAGIDLIGFKEAVAEIRYQHELRLWREEEERRLFNIGTFKQPRDVVDVCVDYSNADEEYTYSLTEDDDEYYFDRHLPISTPIRNHLINIDK